MTKPVDYEGRPLPAANKRLPNAAEMMRAAVFDLAKDSRLVHLDMKQKLRLAADTIDHVFDQKKKAKSAWR